jgi:hypothetical protein
MKQRHRYAQGIRLWSLAAAATAIFAATGPATAADWTPADLDANSVTAWFDGADPSTVLTNGSGGITNWLDKSGHGYHLDATTPSAPTVLAAGLNGRSVVDFHRNSIYRTARVPKSRNESFAVIVWNSDVSNDDEGETGSVRLAHLMLNGHADNRLHCGFDTSDKVKVNLGSTTFESTQSYSQDQWVLFGYGRDTRVGQIWWNGALNVQSDIVVGGGAFTHQQLRFGGNTQGYLDGQIAEILVFDSMPSVPDRQLAEGYLAHKWGLTDSLPAAHPFKSAPPVKHTSFTFDFEHPDGTGSAFADAISLKTRGAIRDTNNVPIGFTISKSPVGAQETDVELTPAGLVMDTRHSGTVRTIMLGVPFATDGGPGVVSITARYTGSYTDWDVPHEMSGILLGNADSTGISNSHTLMGFHMGSFRQVLCPDPWNTGATNVVDYTGEQNITQMVLSGPTTAGGTLTGDFTAAQRHTITQLDGHDDGPNHLGQSAAYAYLFANSGGTSADGFVGTLKSITFRGPNLVVPAPMPRGTVILVR